MKRILYIIICTCLFCSLFVYVKYAFFDTAMKSTNYGMRAICDEKKVSSLYIGSSMFRQGINTAKLDSASYLLAYNGNQPALEYLQIKELIDKGSNIKRIVIDMYPYSAASDLNVSDSRIFMDGNIKYTLDVFSLLKETKGYSYLMNILLQANNDAFVTWPLTHRFINERYYRGANTSTNKGLTNEQLNNMDATLGGLATLNEIQKHGIISIIDFCRRKNIELLFIETPKYIRIHNNDNYIAMMKEYVHLLGSHNTKMLLCNHTASSLNIKDDCDIDSYSFENEDGANFIDLIHMSYKGRNEFSDFLNELLVN